jgi:hypothetical protein
MTKARTIFGRLGRQCRDTRGTAAIEFAIILPTIFIMFMGVVEISNFIILNQRTEKVAHAIADLISQSETITTREMDTILNATEEMMEPFPFGANGHVIITSVHRNPEESPEVAWRYEGGGTLQNVHSDFGGAPGQLSPLPDGFVLNERETVIIAEVYYNYEPFLTSMFSSGSNQLYKYAFYKPRLGALDSISVQ